MILAHSCNKEGQLRLAQLQQELDAIEAAGAPSVPDAVAPVQPAEGVYAFAFDKGRYSVDAGGSVTIHYKLPEASDVEVSATNGWSASVTGRGSAEGDIVVSVPDPAAMGEVVATAVGESGSRCATALNVMIRDPYTDATRPDFLTVGYYGFKPYNASLENYRKLADAGIKAITIETDTDDYMQQLNWAHQVGMKGIMVVWPYAERYEYDPENYKGLDDIINELKDHPATLAYHIYDEPSTAMIPSLKIRKEKIESLDPVHPVYINLGPDASPQGLGVDYYHDYVEAFARDCKVKLLSYDMYPIRPEDDPDYPDGIVGYWYQCQEAVSSISKKYGIPFWGFAASCWIDKEQHLFAKPTVENLRMQIYTNLAYGAQAQEYFTIVQYGGTDYSPMLLDGTWTGAYDTLKEANLEMLKRGYIFTGCTMDRVRYTNLVPAHCQKLAQHDLPPQIASLSTKGNGMVSFIENRGNEYVVVCNRSFDENNTLSLELNDMVYVIDREGAFIECPAGESSFDMEAGDMLVIKVK